MAPPVFKTGLAANIVAGGFDSLPPPPSKPAICLSLLLGCHQSATAPMELIADLRSADASPRAVQVAR